MKDWGQMDIGIVSQPKGTGNANRRLNSVIGLILKELENYTTAFASLSL